MALTPRLSPRLAAVAAVAAVALTAAPEPADARPRPVRRQSNFEANKIFGLGLMVGAPTGLSGKYFLSESTALDFGVGGIGYYRGRDGIHLHADHLWHPFSLVSDPAFELPFYVGVGGRVFKFDEDAGNNLDRDGTVIGVRVPLGIAMDFNRVPLDIFLELTMVFDLFVDYWDDDDFGVDFNPALGLRYWFR
jgi:hypothetical protein